MLEKYNYQIKRIAKLLTILIVTYFAVQCNAPDLKKMEIIKIVLSVGIIFIVLDNYYPNINYE